MDLPTRLVGLQQVMSGIAHMCPKNSTFMLKSAENYHTWVSGVQTLLVPLGLGLYEYFDEGNLLIPLDGSIDDATVMILKGHLNRALQIVLLNTVDADIMGNFQCDGLSGYDLLQAIRVDYSSLSARQLSKLVSTFLKVPSMQPPQALKVLRTFRTQFAHGLDIDHLFGLVYLSSFSDPSAQSRILDVANPQLSLHSVELSLRDLAVPNEHQKAFAAVSQPSRKQSSAPSQHRSGQVVCRRCHGKGHTSIECPAPAPVPKTGGSTSQQSSAPPKHISWACIGGPSETSDSYVSLSEKYTLDSGSTAHVCKDQAHFTSLRPGSGFFTGIGGVILPIRGFGSIMFQNDSNEYITVNNVAYVPDATKNLISVKVITGITGLRASFGPDDCILTDGTPIGIYNSPNLYEFIYSVVIPNKSISDHHAFSANMHSRLGHPSPAVMKALGHKPPPEVKFCDHCLAGNMTRTLPKLATTKTTRPLQLLHVDICGPISAPGLAGERYFLTIVDDLTRWTHIVPLVSKSDAAEVLEHFIIESETKFGPQFKVAAVRSDNGGEFCNNRLREYFYTKGIHHQLTVPYNSSQNGVAERKHRTIQEKARTLLSESGLSKKFWSEAVKVAEFLINRYPSKVLSGVTPFELWNGYLPDYTVLHSFGCHSRVLIPHAHRPDIFDPVSTYGIMVGYDPHRKGYRIFIPELQDIVVSQQVTFHDSYFPMLNPLNAGFQTGVHENITPSDVFFGTKMAGGMPPLSHFMAVQTGTASSSGDPASDVVSPAATDASDSDYDTAVDYSSESNLSYDETDSDEGVEAVADVDVDEVAVVSDVESDEGVGAVADVDVDEVAVVPDVESDEGVGAVAGGDTLAGTADAADVASELDVIEPALVVTVSPTSDKSASIILAPVSPASTPASVAPTSTTDPVSSATSSAPGTPRVPATPSASATPSAHATPSTSDILDAMVSASDDVYPVYEEVDAGSTPPMIPSLLPLRRIHTDDSMTLSLYPAAQRPRLNPADSSPPSPAASSPVSPQSDAEFVSHNIVHQAFSAAAVSSSSLPVTFKQALASHDAALWSAAIATELQAHDSNHTWSIVKLPPGRRAIGCRWVFNIKDANSPPTYKARLVAQGFRQIQGLDYFETFSPVVRYDSIRIIFALSAQYGLAIHQMDVTTAFLNGHLNEEIYMKLPDGVTGADDDVCKLDKSLYGLKQAPLCWNEAINAVLVSAGFTRSISEYGVYTKVGPNGVVIVALYVDDLLICSNDASQIQAVKDLLSSHYKMKDLGLVKTFLGMQVNQQDGQVAVQLSHYLHSFLLDFNMQDCNSVATPFAAGTDFLPGSAISAADTTRYRSMVGKLLFAANTCRPDLAYAASTLSRFIKDPRDNHVAAAKHVLRYIKGTLTHGLVYKYVKDFELVGFSDSDWAGDKADRKSITGYVFTLANAAITWKSKKQPTVALSSTEAEYMALGDTVKELLWLKQLLTQIGLHLLDPPVIYEDNEGCKLLTSHPVAHQRTKHIDIRHHFVRDHLSNNHYRLHSARTDDMFADMFTKNLGRVKFHGFVNSIGIRNI